MQIFFSRFNFLNNTIKDQRVINDDLVSIGYAYYINSPNYYDTNNNANNSLNYFDLNDTNDNSLAYQFAKKMVTSSSSFAAAAAAAVSLDDESLDSIGPILTSNCQKSSATKV